LIKLKIDFGLQIEPQFGYEYGYLRGVARRIEAAGFESIWASDHYLIRQDAVDVDCLEAWTLLTALAVETETLRLGTMVSCQNYRNPALAAKMAATLDNISGGRHYFGVGAGWKEIEYKAYGYEFPNPGARVRQLDEAITIAREVWEKPRADYRGRYYSVNDAVAMPKPIQEPLPVLVGGTGDQVLRVAAKHAQLANFAWNTDLKVYAERLGVLERWCGKLGVDYGSIRKSAGLHLALNGVEAGVPAPYERYSGVKKWDRKTASEAATFVNGYVDLGVSHFVIVFPYGSEAESAEYFMDEVVPLVEEPEGREKTELQARERL
jgi:alkanesulfonate monooxygenase SsuD/methylene tetrahydromethanopterin reductase-like flavin-dependent oxidoreductase (luciferase family)